MHSGRLRAKCFSRNRPCRKEIISTALTGTGTMQRRFSSLFLRFPLFFSTMRSARRLTRLDRGEAEREFEPRCRSAGALRNDRSIARNPVPSPLSPRAILMHLAANSVYGVRFGELGSLTSLLSISISQIDRDTRYFLHLAVISRSISLSFSISFFLLLFYIVLLLLLPFLFFASLSRCNFSYRTSYCR